MPPCQGSDRGSILLTRSRHKRIALGLSFCVCSSDSPPSRRITRPMKKTVLNGWPFCNEEAGDEDRTVEQSETGQLGAVPG